MSSSSDDDRPIAQRAINPSGQPLKPSAHKKPTLSDSDDDVPLGMKAVPGRNQNKPPPKYVDSDSDDDDKPLLARTPVAKKPAAKIKPASKPSSRPSTAGKKTVSSSKKPSVKRSAAKPQSKSKGSATSGKDTAGLKGAAVKKEKKFSLPGQTRDTPAEGEPLLRFYQSLYDQTDGGSDMATKWLLMYGLLPHEVAEAAVARFKKQKTQGTAVKTSNTPSKMKGSPHKSLGSPSPLKRKSSLEKTAAKKVKVKKEH